ncbi:mannose/glucose-specific lectin-like [Phragmites australis]|uniref:mannose/glucose-specific lectin-like n=1 Tax=Phragmites australis TaxID=29695 RepID=UPI002D79C005|nr:mannose/glucose-specific lectin-like [Phragmites australis]
MGRPRREPVGRTTARTAASGASPPRTLGSWSPCRWGTSTGTASRSSARSTAAGRGATAPRKIELDFPYDFVTGISGCYRAAHGGSSPVIRSLTLATRRGTVQGPFGDADADAEGVPFSYPTEGGVVVGFTGRSGWHLDAVGLHVAALRPETLRDVVQERGIAAYRSFVYGSGAAAAGDDVAASIRTGSRSSGATSGSPKHSQFTRQEQVTLLTV